MTIACIFFNVDKRYQFHKQLHSRLTQMIFTGGRMPANIMNISQKITNYRNAM